MIQFKSTAKASSTEDTVGSFKWFVSSMMTLKDHLKFETFSENPFVIRYSSVSESAARALQEYIRASEKYAEETEVHVETKMSAHAPDFKPVKTSENV